MKKKLLAAGMAGAMVLGVLAGCGGGSSSTATSGSTGGGQTSEAKGSVYFLNLKPEQDAQWQELAKLYTEETVVEVKVSTSASGR